MVKNSKKPVKHFGTGVLLGAAAGAIAGLLFAPKSGKETREDIKEGMDDVKDFVGDTSADVADFAKKRTDDAKKFVNENAPKAKKFAKKQAYEAVKMAKKQLDEAKKFAKNVKKIGTDEESKSADEKTDEE